LERELDLPESASADETASEDLSDYQLIETLTPDRTFLCSDASSNVVVLVRLEDDCLYRGGLHPSIRDRLARIRQLPHPRVATLRGVERWNDFPFIVWIYLDGETWENSIGLNPDLFPQRASSLTNSVLGLHELGLVHGNLHGRNVIVQPDGHPWLTQLSPYLYTDPAVDASALIQLLEASCLHLPPPIAQRVKAATAAFDSQKIGLKELSLALLKCRDNEPVELPIANPNSDSMESKYRNRPRAIAIVIVIGAVALAFVVHRSFSKSVKTDRPDFGALKREIH
jgi:hypothetical protein